MKKTAKKRANPIADAIDLSDGICAEYLDIIMQAARSFPMLKAFDDPDGRWIFIATQEPTSREIKEFLRLNT